MRCHATVAVRKYGVIATSYAVGRGGEEEERCWLSWPIAACFGGWSGVEAEVPAAGRWGEGRCTCLICNW